MFLFYTILLSILVDEKKIPSFPHLSDFREWSTRFHIQYNTTDHFNQVYRKWSDNDAFLYSVLQNHFQFGQ